VITKYTGEIEFLPEIMSFGQSKFNTTIATDFVYILANAERMTAAPQRGRHIYTTMFSLTVTQSRM
jgi:hypothetical protein